MSIHGVTFTAVRVEQRLNLCPHGISQIFGSPTHTV